MQKSKRVTNRNKTAAAIQLVALQLLQNRNFALKPQTKLQLKGYSAASTNGYSVLYNWLKYNPAAEAIGQIQGYTVLRLGFVNGVSYFAIRIYSNGQTSRRLLAANTLPALKAVIATAIAINASQRSTNMAVWQYGYKYGGYPAADLTAQQTAEAA